MNEKTADELTRKEKNMALYRKQMAMLDTMLAKGAISKEAYDKGMAALKQAAK